MSEEGTNFRITGEGRDTQEWVNAVERDFTPLHPIFEFHETHIPVIIVSGPDADAVGRKGLQRLADLRGCSVIVEGSTDFHGRSIFHPLAWAEPCNGV